MVLELRARTLRLKGVSLNLVKMRVCGLAAGSTASKAQEAVVKVMAQVSLPPLKQRAALAGVGEALAVPSVTVLAESILNCRVVTPPEKLNVLPPTQPLGDRFTVTVPGYSVEQLLSR